ncbi:hypothetical protein C8R46DRAFT_1221977 [Mycena filopes]|nr:hypothetical protein C8R46DRAFT_1221977 [Mycena filopes]
MSAQSEAHSALPQAACSQLPRPTFQAPGSTVLRCVLTLDRLLGGKIHRTPSRFATIASSLLTAADLDASACATTLDLTLPWFHLLRIVPRAAWILTPAPHGSRGQCIASILSFWSDFLGRGSRNLEFISKFSVFSPSALDEHLHHSLLSGLRRKSSPDEVRGSSGLEVASLHLRLTLIFDPFYRSANCADFGASVGFATLQPASAVHIETPLVQTSADDALDRPSAFAPHTLDIQSPKCLPLLGENAVNLDSSQCVNRLVRAPFDLKLSCVRRSVVCSPCSLRSAKMPELLHIETPLVQTSADDALDSPSAFAPHISDIQSPKCLALLGENGQNSPMRIAPTRPAQGSTQGSARSQALVLSSSPRNPAVVGTGVRSASTMVVFDPILSKPLVEKTRVKAASTPWSPNPLSRLPPRPPAPAERRALVSRRARRVLSCAPDPLTLSLFLLDC